MQVLFIALGLVGLGLVMVYSSSSVLGRVRFADSGFFLERQGVRAVVGILLMMLVSRVPPDLWARAGRPMLLLAMGLLVLVLLVGEGPAHRWLRLPVLVTRLSFQPAEFARLALVIYLADVLARQERLMHDVRNGLVPRLLVVGVVVVLIAAQPDLGTAAAVTMVALTMLWLGGARTGHLLTATLACLPLLALSMYLSRYQLSRITFLWRGGNYQVDQALVALGSGGWFGVGLGNSLQKQQFLPEPHTDFVFAFVGEELGLAGTIGVLAMFVWLTIQGLRIAANAANQHLYLLANGITAMIATYVLLNVGVVTGILPTTGLPLPFISYGGTALIGNLAGVGILLGIARTGSGGSTVLPPGPVTRRHMVRRFK